MEQKGLVYLDLEGWVMIALNARLLDESWCDRVEVVELIISWYRTI